MAFVPHTTRHLAYERALADLQQAVQAQRAALRKSSAMETA